MLTGLRSTPPRRRRTVEGLANCSQLKNLSLAEDLDRVSRKVGGLYKRRIGPLTCIWTQWKNSRKDEGLWIVVLSVAKRKLTIFQMRPLRPNHGYPGIYQHNVEGRIIALHNIRFCGEYVWSESVGGQTLDFGLIRFCLSIDSRRRFPTNCHLASPRGQ